MKRYYYDDEDCVAECGFCCMVLFYALCVLMFTLVVGIGTGVLFDVFAFIY